MSSTYKLNYTDSFGIGDAKSLCPNPVNGFSDSIAQQTPMQATNDLLVEFSEALRTAAKTLRGAAEGKVLAQAETVVWKCRYELERSKNVELQHKELSCGVCADESNSPRMEHVAKSPRLHAQENSSNGMERIWLENVCDFFASVN